MRTLCLPFSSMKMPSGGGPGAGARGGIEGAGNRLRSFFSWRLYWPGLALRSTVAKEGMDARWRSDRSRVKIDVQPLACVLSILFSLWVLCRTGSRAL